MAGTIKFFGMVLIVASCTGLGFQLAFLYSRRIRQCRQVEQCLQRLLGEIRFHQLPLAEALRETGQAITEAEFSAFLIRVADRLDAGCTGKAGNQTVDLDENEISLGQLWQQELVIFLEKSLIREEQELLSCLGQELGVLDLEAQVRSLQYCLDQWHRNIEELQRQEESHGRLYRGVGVSAGVFLAILLL